jgi:hypothetical protein
MQYNTDRYGNDLYKIELDAANQNLCMAECLSNPDCVSYAYVSPGIQAENALCYIKGAAGTPKAMQGVISGLRSACEKEFVDGACMAVDVDRYGSDYERFEMEQPDPYACLAACMKDNRCSMYAFLAPGIQSDNAVCYLKSGSPPAPSSTRGVISGKIGSCLR